MLRKTHAKWLAFGTAALVVAMAAVFAWLRNATAPGATPASAAGELATRDSGRVAFERLNCTSCHSIGGVGNPARPLDGVGARLNRAQLRAWTTGTGAARKQLPDAVVRRKAAAADDPQLEALLDHLERSK